MFLCRREAQRHNETRSSTVWSESCCVKCLRAVSRADSFTFWRRKPSLSGFFFFLVFFPSFAHLVLLLLREPDVGLNSIIPQRVPEIPLQTHLPA